MTKLKIIPLILIVALGASGCTRIFDNGNTDKTRDRGRDHKDLSNLIAGIWVDPNGCDHWIIDDGIEGYLSARLHPNGKPVCSGHGAETVAYGPYKSGSWVNRWTERR